MKRIVFFTILLIIGTFLLLLTYPEDNLLLSDSSHPEEAPSDPSQLQSGPFKVDENSLFNMVEVMRFFIMKIHVREVTQSALRFFINGQRFPENLDDLQRGGEINKKFLARVKAEQISLLKVDPYKIFIYSLFPDPLDSEHPYIGVFVEADGSHEYSQYSREELEVIINPEVVH